MKIIPHHNSIISSDLFFQDTSIYSGYYPIIPNNIYNQQYPETNEIGNNFNYNMKPEKPEFRMNKFNAVRQLLDTVEDINNKRLLSANIRGMNKYSYLYNDIYKKENFKKIDKSDIIYRNIFNNKIDQIAGYNIEEFILKK